MAYLIFAIGLLFTVCFAYQAFYVLVGLFKKPVLFEESKPNRFAVIISARNESAVIENLLNSINAQSYPKELLDVYVIADNCDDNTAEICRNCGAIVYERSNKKQIGKGYALDFLFDHIRNTVGEEYYDGFFVFDADNLLEPDFIEQMNKTFSAGYKIVTSYRNSKNYGTNWISSGYALWFLREAKYLSNARMILNSSCAISGTGFLVHRDMIWKRGGWKYFLLTEDIEFTVANIIDGEKVGYCHNAILYDEQPETFKQSWNQRLRWAKGFLQVFGKYGKRLWAGVFKNKNKNRFSCYDLSITIFPLISLTIITFLLYIAMIVKDIVLGDPALTAHIWSAVSAVLGSYGTLFLMGLVTVITEWNYINCTTSRKIISLFTFPIYMFTWIPIGFVALFKKVEWTPIKHSVNKNVHDMKNKKNK